MVTGHCLHDFFVDFIDFISQEQVAVQLLYSCRTDLTAQIYTEIKMEYLERDIKDFY